ncbi:23525_t:CDS:2 [Cetraspora pellucida]|uniref:23525_t:CDS:1 n=1 Tax=Cetraspora pellucida TaxID=1433469 RepID=A0A9N9F2A5_9GLOM|nr:23525_t:CDS:2 [Cetraspora pellucida]
MYKSTRLARKDFRKLKKKQRKKALRIDAAKIMEQKQGMDLSYYIKRLQSEEAVESTKAEEIKLNVERILWEARERHIDQENWEKTVKSIKKHKPSDKTMIMNSSTLTSSPTSIVTTTSFQETTPIESDYGTEKVVYPELYLDVHPHLDQINCPFYLKTGACRYGSSCGRHHSYPDKGVTILIKNMYEGMPVQLADEDNDDNLEYDEVEAERHYHEFFEDVHSEFQQYGTIVQFKVCNNFQMHLRGNVYVQFSKEYEAEQALRTIRGRWYAGKQLICEYCPVTNWRSAICGRYLCFIFVVLQILWISLTFACIGHYEKNKCPKGIHCNFLHVFKNPGGLYSSSSKT